MHEMQPKHWLLGYYKIIEVIDMDFEINRELEIAAKRVKDLRDSL